MSKRLVRELHQYTKLNGVPFFARKHRWNTLWQKMAQESVDNGLVVASVDEFLGY